MSKFLVITSLFAIFIFTSFLAKAAEEDIKGSSITDKINAIEEDFFVDEETVTISIIKFGRKNPFKPYTKSTGISVKKEGETLDLDEIPYPPFYEGNVNLEVQELMASKVNGILYDPYARSVAIVNIKGSEHLLHKGDIVQGIMLDNISENYITLKYGANTYTVGVGEVVEGTIQHDSAQRKQKIFAGSDYDLPDLNLEE